jgi:hypothetical protein
LGGINKGVGIEFPGCSDLCHRRHDLGLTMAISVDHATLPAHAHLNLLGLVSLFLFGIYYRLHPSLEGGKSASVQVWAWIVGTIILTIGVALVHAGHAIGIRLRQSVRSSSFSICCCSAGWYFVGSVRRRVFQPTASPAK